MKYIAPLIVASFMLAIVIAMLEEGPLTLPFLVGYLLGIVVPVVVYTGSLTLLVAGIYRLYMAKKMSNLFTIMWIIWVFVAAVNFYGNYQNQQQRRAAQMAGPYGEWSQENNILEWQLAQDEPGRPAEILALQSRFASDSQKLDAELARSVATISIPPLFNPAFLEDKSHFPAAVIQLENYGQLFHTYKATRNQILSQMKTAIEQLDLPQSDILQAVQEFNNTYELDGQFSDKYLNIVIEVSQQGVAYLNFLQHASYQVSNGQVVFEANSETDQHLEFLQNFKRLSEQETAAQRELLDSREKRIQRLRELSR